MINVIELANGIPKWETINETIRSKVIETLKLSSELRKDYPHYKYGGIRIDATLFNSKYNKSYFKLYDHRKRKLWYPFYSNGGKNVNDYYLVTTYHGYATKWDSWTCTLLNKERVSSLLQIIETLDSALIHLKQQQRELFSDINLT